MLLHAAAINVSNPQNSFTNISIQTHGKRPACEATGTIKLMSEDKTEFSRSWQRNTSDWVMTLDPQAFSGGVLRVTSAINTMIADQVKKVRK
jgi:tartrate dehydratase alpha subunit/fumarate hydratase class I-like protein